MRFIKVEKRSEDVFRSDHYVVDLSASDIHRPSNHLLKFAQGRKTFSFLNAHTVEDFTRQVRSRYVEGVPPITGNE